MGKRNIIRDAPWLPLILPVIIFLGFIYLYPIIKILCLSFLDPQFTLRNFAKIFEDSANAKVMWLTFKMGFGVTVSCLILGYPIAYLLDTIPQRVANLLMLCVVIPLWTSVLVRTYAWMVLLGRNGVFNQFLIRLGIIDQPIKMMFNTFGVYVGMVQILLPFMILPLYSVMRGIDKDLIKAANNLGAGPIPAFLRVYFPLSLPGVVSGFTLVFIMSLGFFITPALLGGLGNIMISMFIESNVNEFLNWGLASALSVVLLLLTGLAFLLFKLLARGLRVGSEGAGTF